MSDESAVERAHVNRRIGVLISGRGTNLQSLIDVTRDGRLDATIAIVIANQEQAAGLARARDAGIETLVVSHRGWGSREEYERALVTELKARDVGVVCLAGFMRILAGPVINAFPDAVLNIHPALLPAFPGVDAARQAFEYGVKVSGVTVHLVTRELDAGPILLQRAVQVLDSDTPESLAARILEQEHIAYPQAVAMLLNGWKLEGRRFVRRR